MSLPTLSMCCEPLLSSPVFARRHLLLHRQHSSKTAPSPWAPAYPHRLADRLADSPFQTSRPYTAGHRRMASTPSGRQVHQPLSTPGWVSSEVRRH